MATIFEARTTVSGVPAWPSMAARQAMNGDGRKHLPADVPALDAFRRRLDLLVEADVAIAEAEFASEFGRDLQYYTGFVFEFTAAWLGRNSPVAGGGRYDTLLEAVGAANQVPAVGACIHTKRLREVLEEAAP